MKKERYIEGKVRYVEGTAYNEVILGRREEKGDRAKEMQRERISRSFPKTLTQVQPGANLTTRL